jgi:hypothetical protein
MAAGNTPSPIQAADAAPDNHDDLIARYQARRALHQATANRLGLRRGRVFQAVAVLVVLVLWLTARNMHSASPGWILLLAFIVIAGLIWLSLHLQAGVTRQERLVRLYRDNLRRVAPDAAAEDDLVTGPRDDSALRPPGHLYADDLDLLGPNSLLAQLDTVRTGPGRGGLARYLLEPATHAETLARQEAVRELLPNLELRERIALLGASSFQQISGTYFDQWLDQEVPTFHPAWPFVLAVTAVVACALLLVGFTHLWPWGQVLPNLFADLAVQGGICYLLLARVKPLLEGGARLQGSVRLFAEGLALLQKGSFISVRLRALQAAALEPAGAVKALAQLENQLAIVEQRPKEYFLLLSLLLAAGTQAAMAIAKWKRAHADAMRAWIAAWSEFEALNALATYAFEHPEDVWPELLPNEVSPTFAAEALGHPLLNAAVTNDVVLGETTRFYLISGSNMAGKSTLLRSIGINAVLAYAGAPVRARSLQLTPLRLGASLALTDSLSEGKSKFLAEVERLSAVVAQSREAPMLFLVDEIFSGTNSMDRRTAAGAVLRSLLAGGAIGALSTHDLALTDLADASNGGVNVHMASPDPGDPLAFDYKLKPGINTSSNALAILRMMGLDA